MVLPDGTISTRGAFLDAPISATNYLGNLTSKDMNIDELIMSIGAPKKRQPVKRTIDVSTDHSKDSFFPGNFNMPFTPPFLPVTAAQNNRNIFSADT